MNHSSPTETRPASRQAPWLMAGALLLTLGLRALAVSYAPLNQDEGWYALSALLARSGATPFADFAFTQGPLFPYVFGLLLPFWETLAELRWVNACLGGLVLVPCVLLLRSLTGPQTSFSAAALLLFLLCGWSPYLATFGATVKTYSLAALLFTSACWVWVKARNSSGGWRWAMVAGILFGLAGATRLSLLVAAPVAGLLVWIAHGRAGWRHVLA